MVYFVKVNIDGGCRGNGKDWAFGAAAAVHMRPWGKHKATIHRLCKTKTSPVTSQRAEITALIMALELAIAKYDSGRGSRLKVEINSDSRHVVDGMNHWIHTWRENGWLNAQGSQVANRDLWKKASRLDERVEELGWVRYRWVPRERNKLADEYCNEELDEMENEQA